MTQPSKLGGPAAFDAFCALVGDAVATDAMEQIADCLWNRKGTEAVTIRDIHQHNACNHTISGTINVAGVEYGFVVESGDIHGTVVHEWGDAEDVGTFKPEPPVIWTFVPIDPFLKERRPAMWAVYLAWTKEAWFKEKAAGYNYDRHFAPGGKTENYYREWAAKKGMKPAPQERAA